MKVVITNQAECDLDSLYVYIARQLSAPLTAQKMVDEIKKSTELLADMPEMRRIYDEPPWNTMGIRIYNVKKYNILYLPDMEKKVVHIIRIIYCGMDIDRALQETDFEEIT